MAVSILRGPTSHSLGRLPFLHNALHSRSVKIDDIMKIHDIVGVFDGCFMEERGRGSFEMGPSIPGVVSDGGEAGVLRPCVVKRHFSCWFFSVSMENYFVLLCFNVA